MSELAARILEVAAAEVGTREEPPGSNDGTRVRVYQEAVRMAAPGKWCAAFVCWVCRQAGALIVPSASVARLLERNRHLQVPIPAPGDVFIHLGDFDHTGFVESVEAGHIATIEGNRHDRVQRDTRARDYPTCYLRVS